MSAHALPAVLAAAIVVVSAPPAAADPAETARSIQRTEGIQTELPLRSATPPGLPGIAVPGAPGGVEIPLPSSPIPGLVLIAIALAVLIALVIPRLVPARAPVAAAPTAAPASSSRASSVEDPEALARQARFAEAIHSLLLRALGELGRLPGSVAASPSATSREILRHRSLPAEVQAALDPIVRAVERFHFGGDRAAADDYAWCAAQYGRFRDAWRTAR